MINKFWSIVIFNIIYLSLAGAYFAQDLNLEFVIYVAVIVVILLAVFATLKYTKFPHWMLWAFSIWGLMHVLGGLVETRDGVLFAYRIYPFFDGGGEFFILKYDQFVHFYLYGLVAAMSYHLLRNILKIRQHLLLVSLFAIMASVGVSAQNEIMEFLIAVNLERHGVGGFENAMLDLIFNTAGAMVAVIIMAFKDKKNVLS